MTGELLLQVSAIPAIAELIEVALDVHFAEVVISAFEEAFSV